MKKISNWLIGVWGSLMGYFMVFPADLTSVWMVMPHELKDAMPPYVAKAIGFAVLVAAMLGKMHKQRVENVQLKQKVADVAPSDEVNDGH